MSRFYRKINSPYKRDKKGVFIPEFSDPEFEENLDEEWTWSFKWDGTSVGFEAGGDPFGRSENAALSWDQWQAVRTWQNDVEDLMDPQHHPDYVYGELIGPGIQDNRHGVDCYCVVPFDARWGNRFQFPGEESWQVRMSLRQVIDQFRAGVPDMALDIRFASPGGSRTFDPYYVEGVVGRRYCADVASEDLITKLKVKDRWSW